MRVKAYRAFLMESDNTKYSENFGGDWNGKYKPRIKETVTCYCTKTG